jgi:hypothetical protein
LKRIFSSFNLAAAHHVRNLLDAGGVRAVVKNEFLSSVMGDLPPAECQAEVWLLRDADAERANELLLDPQDHGERWTCPGCGEIAEPQFAQCWQCGAQRA